MHQLRFRLGQPTVGAYSTPPDPLAGFKGSTSKEKGGDGRKGKKERGGEEREGDYTAPGTQSVRHPLEKKIVPVSPVLFT